MVAPLITFYQEQVEAHLPLTLPADETLPGEIHQAMRYSLLAGGKRFRPTLCLAAASACGGDIQQALNVACAIEMIHTYSLIHDDLPGMDNDDYRRGKLTNHKVFGEGMAILAGDGLLTRAFALIAEDGLATGGVEKALRIIQVLGADAGTRGMIGGQVIDLQSENKQIDFATLKQMHAWKTGALIVASVVSGGILADASMAELAQLREYGEQVGLAFQITDDILDVVGDSTVLGKLVGSDAKNHKSTYPALFGLEQSQQMAVEAVAAAKKALVDFDGDVAVLKALADGVVGRQQ